MEIKDSTFIQNIGSSLTFYGNFFQIAFKIFVTKISFEEKISK